MASAASSPHAALLARLAAEARALNAALAKSDSASAQSLSHPPSRRPHAAYYTDDDVAAYIARATIPLALLDCIAGDAWLWRLLQHDPERYIFPAARHGLGLVLPAELAAGLHNAAKRAAWNEPADETFGLPRELWRETIARHARCAELIAQVRAGAISSTDDLLTFNLDAPRLLLDYLAHCDEAALVLLWEALTRLTVLDPTCGTGAFLLAALDTLEPFYQACLARLPALGGGLEPHTAAQGATEQAGFVFQAILANNLYGVDLMAEAVAVCRLRLLARRVTATGELIELDQLAEVLPNIRQGNALSGFDWQANFVGVFARGGFDVIVGNPPYLAAHKVRDAYRLDGYQTAPANNLYALVLERSLALLNSEGRLGMIVPVASVATQGMASLQRLYAGLAQWHSHYAVRPGKLFADVDMNLTISLLQKRPAVTCYVSGYRRWSNRRPSERPYLFSTLAYTAMPALPPRAAPFPKLGSALEARILTRMHAEGRLLGDYACAEGTTLFYHSGGRYWRKALLEKLSSHYKPLSVPPHLAPLVFCLLNSQLFYWYWICHSNCMDLVGREVRGLPVFRLEASDPAPFLPLMEGLLAAYAEGRRQRVRRGARISVDEVNFDLRQARPLIDAIDRQLARAYGFTAEELDFILHFDQKYRG